MESTYVEGTRIIPMHPLSVTVIVRFVMAKHNTCTGTFPVTLLIIIVCANLKAGADTVCLGVGVYLCIFHIIYCNQGQICDSFLIVLNPKVKHLHTSSTICALMACI